MSIHNILLVDDSKTELHALSEMLVKRGFNVRTAENAEEAMERAGFYFQNWNKLLDNWHVKVRGVIDGLEALRYEPLPDMVHSVIPSPRIVRTCSI